MRITLLGAIALFVLIVSSSVSAQTGTSGASGEPDVTRARVRFGRLMLNPTIVLTNLGIDTNVFNEPDQSAPKRDFTITVTPQTDLWLRMGRSWVTGTIKEDLVWYQTFANQRSANHYVKGGWVIPLNRLAFNVGADYLSTRERPGFEIDVRSQRTELGYVAGLEVRAQPKLFVGVRGEQRTTDYDSSETFAGANLQLALDRTVTSQAAALRHQITPITALTLTVERSQDRFQFSPERDSDSTSVSAGVKLDRFALIKGSASFGYRDFQPVSSSLPAYKGTIATADLSYVALSRMQVAVQALRDVEYSFDINEPYYLLSGVSGSLVYQIFDKVDVIGRLGVQQLDYRRSLDALIQSRHRVDHVRMSGGGIGVRLGNDLRIRFNVDRQYRTSPVTNHEYHGLTFGTSVTYAQ